MQHTNQTNITIDNLAFAKNNERLAGRLQLADCQRLQAILAQSLQYTAAAGEVGQIQYELIGRANALQHFLQLNISASLMTACQRCLNAMPLTLTLSFNYLISDINDEAFEALELDDHDDYDMQQASPSMDVAALIEDEVIMALPFAPTHAEDCAAPTMQSGEKPNPFAVLKDLKLDKKET